MNEILLTMHPGLIRLCNRAGIADWITIALMEQCGFNYREFRFRVDF